MKTLFNFYQVYVISVCIFALKIFLFQPFKKSNSKKLLLFFFRNIFIEDFILIQIIIVILILLQKLLHKSYYLMRDLILRVFSQLIYLNKIILMNEYLN